VWCFASACFASVKPRVQIPVPSKKKKKKERNFQVETLLLEAKTP
jgi:predicted amidophosphoribosyltransferase